jgi:hypothetical protein
MNVRDLDIDLIDHINPFESAYAVLSKAMDEATQDKSKLIFQLNVSI